MSLSLLAGRTVLPYSWPLTLINLRVHIALGLSVFLWVLPLVLHILLAKYYMNYKWYSLKTLCMGDTIYFILFILLHCGVREHSGSDVECLNWDRVAGGLSLTGITALYPWAGHFNASLVLVQLRKTRLFITERLLIGHKDQIKQTLWFVP